ncbi:hypothetical protein V1477_015164 [Vespula maculifrons]|uniref:Uncharacterized protein n=1 Tax=Vespula maculifrons TaxID=7453 RepID=A0ABD2BJI0_VESMC
MDVLNIVLLDENQNTKIELDFSILNEGDQPKAPSQRPTTKGPIRKLTRKQLIAKGSERNWNN